MPLYAYQCIKCKQEWEAWHTVTERENEKHCGAMAVMLPTIFSGRPNGIVDDKPKLKQKEKVTSQIYDSAGNKTQDNAPINNTIDRLNKKIRKTNKARGHKDD